MFLVKKKFFLQKLIKFYYKEKYQFSFIWSVLSGIQNGKVYVDNKIHPKSIFIRHKFGWSQFIGVENKEFIKKIINKFKKKKIRLFNTENIVLDFKKKQEGKRIQFFFKKKIDIEFNNPKFKFKKISRKNFFKISKQLNLKLNKNFWTSRENFFENSFGYFAELDSKIVSICYSCASYKDSREIDVFTIEKFRGQNLAKYLCFMFIKHCIKKKLKPRWDCYLNNHGSIKLAKSLGFKINLEPYKFIILN